MREIGGYIQLDNYTGRSLHEGAVALNCGRSALAYLIEAQDIRKLYIPYFCCDAVSKPGRDAGIELEYYHTDSSFRPIFHKTLEDGQWLLVVNYYGQINQKELAEYKTRFGRVIADNTQAYFQPPAEGMDTLYSCRKYFGVSDGAYLYTHKRLNRELEADESFERLRYVLGRYERGGEAFYAEACANNAFFDTEPIKHMSPLTTNLLRAIDYDETERVRRENFTVLHGRLGEKNPLKLTIPRGPFMYPYYQKNGGELRKRLQEKKLYIPTLWPDVFKLCPEDSLEYDYAQNILPLPIDQRYNADDMKYICEVLENV